MELRNGKITVNPAEIEFVQRLIEANFRSLSEDSRTLVKKLQTGKI